MSLDRFDAALLTSLWLIPLLGAFVVLIIPKRATESIKWVSLGFTILMLLMSLVAFRSYVTPGPSGDAPVDVPLAKRAESNVLGWDEIDQGTMPLAAMDRNQDGSIQRAEFTADKGLFENLDTEKDGDRNPNNDVLSPTEIEHAGIGDLVIREPWIPYFHIQYYLGLDGISLSLVLLTSLVTVLACVASWNIDKQVKGYYSLFLLLAASMMGVFLALDLFLFYVFFEVMLLPMYFLIGIWGGENREYAAIKFLLYTLFGSVFILVAILILYFWTGDSLSALNGLRFAAHSFDTVKLARVASETTYYGLSIQRVIFLLFLVGFCVKLPAVPFHTWLPDAHVQAPTPISMILAGILLKVGGYGLVRLAWPLAPVGAYDLSTYVAVLGVVSIVYGALAAMAQTDFKRLVAYSSVSHMGYVTLGMAAMSLGASFPNPDPRIYAYGVNGAMFMMIAHGITSSGMFFLVGVIYDRAHTRDLNKLGGLFNPMPVYGAVSFIIFFGSMGLPGLCGFIAEAFVVLAAFKYNVWIAIIAAMAVILTAGYILWTLQRVFLGRNEQYRGLPDLTLREFAIAVPLVFFTIVLGVFPQSSLLKWMSPSVDQTVKAIALSVNQGAPPIQQAQAGPVVRPR
ncbi:MAG TPA: NADH-quinone oxidoreductase subunit M [Isosphaeraceae bacterium]|jgi:NADH-quinone oxidoreductase subunit M|nr:NADH-quinone oxidoreductase subunit M [Isosphaeraceae bacterium]